MRTNWNKKIPPKIKEYLVNTIGERETKRLIHFMNMENWIMLTGPTCSGKTTIRQILLSLGYPYVVDDAGLGRVVNTKAITQDLRPWSDIFEELEIEKKCYSVNMDIRQN